jgi:hypothetical protein
MPTTALLSCTPPGKTRDEFARVSVRAVKEKFQPALRHSA